MIAIDPFRPQIEAEVGPIRAVSAITKGFSFEKKLKLTSDRGDFLARLWYDKHMSELAQTVTCNFS